MTATIRRALNHYRALNAELRRQEETERKSRLLEIAELNRRIEAEQLHDRLMACQMAVRP
jgi:hypothetical protein